MPVFQIIKKKVYVCKAPGLQIMSVFLTRSKPPHCIRNEECQSWYYFYLKIIKHPLNLNFSKTVSPWENSNPQHRIHQLVYFLLFSSEHMVNLYSWNLKILGLPFLQKSEGTIWKANLKKENNWHSFFIKIFTVRLRNIIDDVAHEDHFTAE